MPAHLRPPERRAARTVGALAVAVGIALLVVAGFSGGPAEEGTTQLVQPVTDASTEPTVLGSETERGSTVPDAPPASAAGFTTTTSSGDTGDDGGPVVTSPQLSPSPTLGPPVSVTRPPRPRPTTTTTTTAPPTTSTTASTTTTMEEPTTTTEDTTTTTQP